MYPLILSLNPSIDAEWQVKEVLWEEKNRVLSERRWAGGKGVNVARWIKFLGGHPRLILPLGGAVGTEIRHSLEAEGISCQAVPIQAANRVDVIITTEAGKQLRFNPAGPELTSQEWQNLRTVVEQELPRCSVLVLSGSLPRGADPGLYGELIHLARQKEVHTLLDCDGMAFAKGVEAQPFLVKPNEFELQQWLELELEESSMTACGAGFYQRASGASKRGALELWWRDAARKLARRTGGWVLLTRGPKTAFLVNSVQNQGFQAKPPKRAPQNSVGAGDALVAAVAMQCQGQSPPEDWLRWGLAAGTAATQCQGGILPAEALISSLANEIAARGL